MDPDDSPWFQRNPIEVDVFRFLWFKIQFQIYIKYFINIIFTQIIN